MKGEKNSRCCIISGKSSENALPKKNNDEIAIKKHLDTYISKFKKYIDKKKAENELMSMMIFSSIIVALCVALLFFTPAYDVYIDGHKIGSVPDKEYFSAVYDNVNYDIMQIAGDSYMLSATPAYVYRIIPKNMFTSLDVLTDNLMMLSSGIKRGFVVYADGKRLIAAESEEAVNMALDAIKAEYEGENASFVNNIEIKPEYVAGIFSTDILTQTLLDSLSVKTQKTITYSEPVYYPTEEIPTDSLRLGKREIVQPGTDGLREVTAQVTYVNGDETEKTVLSSVETSAPVTEIVNVGTHEVTNLGTGSFALPFDGTVSSRFGSRWGRTHKGLDLAGKEGSPVEAADNGTVITAEMRSDYGNLIILDHNNGMETYYAHLSYIDVEVGDIVEKGEVIGKVGNTGMSTGPHLHFEVRIDGVPQNPADYIY